MAVYQHTCEYCGNGFTSSRPHSRFCPPRIAPCRVRHHRETKRPDTDKPRQQTPPPAAAPVADDRVVALLEAQNDLLQQLVNKTFTVQTSTIVSTGVASPRTSTNSAAIDDFDLEITASVSKEKAHWNLAIQAAMMDGSINSLSPDVLAYGVEMGKIDESKLSDAVRQFIHHASAPRGAKAMDVPQFDAPEIDIDDLDF